MKGDEKMGGYRKLNFNKLTFADDTLSYEESLNNVTPLNIPNEVITGKRQLKVTKAERDCEKKCVKLEISC